MSKRALKIRHNVIVETLETANQWQRIPLAEWTRGWLIQARETVSLDVSLLPGRRRWFTLRPGTAHSQLGNPRFVWVRSATANVNVEILEWGDEEAAEFGLLGQMLRQSAPSRVQLQALTSGITYADLLVESATNPNLLVGIRQATRQAVVNTLATALSTGSQALVVKAGIGGIAGTVVTAPVQFQSAYSDVGLAIGVHARIYALSSATGLPTPLTDVPYVDPLVVASGILVGNFPLSLDAADANNTTQPRKRDFIYRQIVLIEPLTDTAFDTRTGIRAFSLLVNNTGAAASWDVELEGSLNGSNWVTIVNHLTADGSGTTKNPANQTNPYRHVRVRRVNTAGGGSVTATYFGMP